MKFEKFLKNCGARGTVITTKSDGKFLKLANVLLAIPDGVNVLSNGAVIAPDYIEDILTAFWDGDTFTAELTDAKLPTPDASPSKVERVFSNGFGGQITVDNKTFGIIERSDRVFTYEDDGESSCDQNALVVVSGYGDNEYISGVLLATQYYNDKVTNKQEG